MRSCDRSLSDDEISPRRAGGKILCGGSANTARGHMVKSILVLVTLTASAAQAATPPQTMYNNALSREKVIRAALADPDAPSAILAELRSIVAAYELIVRHYSTSGYSDNALWQGGNLSLDAFTRFGQARDRERGLRLLHKLAAVYVNSSLAPKVTSVLARAEGTAAPPRVPETARPGDAQTPAAAAATSGAAAPADDARTIQKPRAVERQSPKAATIKNIRRVVLPDAVRVTIELDGEVPFHDERIANPARVFVDLPSTRPAPALVDQTLRFDGDEDIVRQIRVGRHPNNVTRVVLEAAGVSGYSVYPLYGPYRLVIDCVRMRTAEAPVAELPAREPLAREAPAKESAARPPAPVPSAKSSLTTGTGELAAKVADPPPVGPVTPPASTEPASKNLHGGFSIARQLGLGVSRIVIDPGHGGHDPGAIGKGVTESELVLDVAQRLEKLLQNAGVDVILTRRGDEFIQLQERTAIANREGADLFLSIHANASGSAQARGIETYFLNFANTMNAAAVAARENAASGQAMGALPDIVKAIALNNKLDESRDFATEVQRAMVDRLRPANRNVKDLGVRQAPFVVLIGAAMPSVLAEISFVTNVQEARLLKGGAYRQKIAEALFAAIRKYQGSLRTRTAVALQ